MNKLLEMRDRIEQKREERIMKKIEGNKIYSQWRRKKPLYVELEEKYKAEIEEPEL